MQASLVRETKKTELRAELASQALVWGLAEDSSASENKIIIKIQNQKTYFDQKRWSWHAVWGFDSYFCHVFIIASWFKIKEPQVSLCQMGNTSLPRSFPAVLLAPNVLTHSSKNLLHLSLSVSLLMLIVSEANSGFQLPEVSKHPIRCNIQ